MPTEEDAAFAASYSLNRQVPDMSRGFTIGTNYGDMIITADEAREHPELVRAVESILQFRLHVAGRAGGAA